MTGARVQFEGSQGGGDDTAMNGIQFKYKSTADTGRDIYRLKLESNSWEKIGGKLKHVSVGSANTVWGVNINDDIYRWNGSGWVYIGGKLKQISVAADGTVWGVNSADTIYRRTGSNTWENIPGKLKYVSVGDANTVWGVNANDYIYRWTGSGWENIAGGLKQIEVAADGTVWGVNSGDAIYRRTGLDIKLSLKAADCPLTGYRFPVLDSNSQLRDVHGQLTTMQGAFGFTNLGGLETDFKSCQNEARQEYDKPDSDMSLDDLTKAYNECLREKLYEPIDTSLELVFGSKPSIGFICGIKDAVRQYSKNDGKALPGHCCLDAPFQLDDQHWGYEV